MPNIATVLKDEVLRLARKEVRKETEGLKKASAQYRSEIAALKRRMVAQEKEIHRLAKGAGPKTKIGVEPGATNRLRYSPKGFAKMRKKLGLSAHDLGLLMDVSAQTVYNWEAEKSRPQAKQLAAIAAVRGMGKREIRARLAALAGSQPAEEASTKQVKPKTAKAKPTKPQAAKPKAAKPKATKPKATKVKATKVKATKVKATKVKAAKVKAAKPQAAKSKPAKPKAAKSEVAKPKAEKLQEHPGKVEVSEPPKD